MALSATQKLKVRAALHRAYCSQQVAIPWSKSDVDATVTALDNFLDANAAAINTALPQPFRTSASTGDKAVLLATITMARYLVDNPSLAGVMSYIAGEVQQIAEG